MGCGGRGRIKKALSNIRKPTILIVIPESFPDVNNSSMTIVQELLNQHERSMLSSLEKLLAGISSSRDIKSDANITKMMELNASLINHYLECSSLALSQLEHDRPSIVKQISVNMVKRHRVEKTSQAIAEREEKRTELMRKLKSLRKNVPEAMRETLKGSR